MLDLSDLGLEPLHSASTDTAAAVVENDDKRDRSALVAGSILARALYEVWSGRPVTVVDSPPGAGKTTMLVDLLEHLLVRSPFNVIVATPTRAGAFDLCGRLAAVIDEIHGAENRDRPRVVYGVRAADKLPKGCLAAGTGHGATRHVTARTIDSLALGPVDCDLLVVDEAYQATFSKVMAAGDGAKQVLMVGDPGQIGPVVTTNTAAWERMTSAPHRRAPEVFARREDACVLRLDATYRLGPDTTRAIAPLYAFDFASRRPLRTLSDRAGVPVPELSSLRVSVPESGTSDLGVMEEVAEAAIRLLDSQVVTTLPDGSQETHTLGTADVAVVVAHNAQQTAVAAILESLGRGSITVGTADSLQGGQWHAVVALDPIVGHPTLTGFQIAAGRLCVMASRHMTHLTWVHDGTSEKVLSDYAEEETGDSAKRGIAVRRALTEGER